MIAPRLIGVAVVLAGVGGRAAEAQPANGLARIGVTLETTSGRPVLEIDCAKFEIRVDDRLRPIRECTNALPVTVALLLDVSASFGYETSIPSMVDELASHLRPVDRLGVGWFASTIQVPPVFTRDRRTLAAAADAARDAAKARAGPSPLWDALRSTVEALTSEPGRLAAIVITDGRATGNTAPFPVAAREIVMSGVEIHVIGRPFIPYTLDRTRPEVDLVNRPAVLALASGGTASQLGRGFELVRPQLRDILSGLQRSYLLTFDHGASPGEIHRLDVRVGLPGLTVRAPDRFGAR